MIDSHHAALRCVLKTWEGKSWFFLMKRSRVVAFVKAVFVFVFAKSLFFILVYDLTLNCTSALPRWSFQTLWESVCVRAPIPNICLPLTTGILIDFFYFAFEKSGVSIALFVNLSEKENRSDVLLSLTGTFPRGHSWFAVLHMGENELHTQLVSI